MMKTTITVQVTISMGHRLPSYKGICSSPHGHNVKIEVEVDPGGVFLDFKSVQRELKSVTDPMDHAMVLWHRDPLLKTLDDLNFRVYSLQEEPTTEAIAREIWSEMVTRNFNVLRVVVHETDKYSATIGRQF